MKCVCVFVCDKKIFCCRCARILCGPLLLFTSVFLLRHGSQQITHTHILALNRIYANRKKNIYQMIFNIANFISVTFSTQNVWNEKAILPHEIRTQFFSLNQFISHFILSPSLFSAECSHMWAAHWICQR